MVDASKDYSFKAASTTNTDFALGKSISLGTQPTLIEAGKFTGDTKDDLAVVTRWKANVDRNHAGTTPGELTIYAGGGDDLLTVKQTLDAGVFPSKLVKAKLNNDGFDDLVLLTNKGYTVMVFLSDGLGDFTSSTIYTATHPIGDIWVQKLNTTQAVDDIILPLNSNKDTALVALVNGGSGTFTTVLTTPQEITGTTDSTEVAIAGAYFEDMNSDGNLDAAFTDRLNNKVYIVAGNSGTKGKFDDHKSTFTVGSNPSAIQSLGYVTANSSKDLVVLNQSSGTLSILERGTGTNFTLSATTITLPSGNKLATEMSKGKYTGSNDELLLYSQASTEASILRITGNKTHEFINLSIKTGFSPVLANVDSGSTDDLIFSEYTPRLVRIYKKNTPPAETFSSTVIGFSEVIGNTKALDLDGDNDQDLAVLLPLSDQIRIFINKTTP